MSTDFPGQPFGRGDTISVGPALPDVDIDPKLNEPISTDLSVAVPTELLDVRSGEVVEATPAKAAELIVAARDMRGRLLGLVKDCEAVLLDESKRQGTKTLHFPEGTATVTGGTEVEWNVDILRQLISVGLPDARWEELYVATVTYKVDARVAKQLEAANPAYANIITKARSYVQKAWRVSVR